MAPSVLPPREDSRPNGPAFLSKIRNRVATCGTARECPLLEKEQKHLLILRFSQFDPQRTSGLDAQAIIQVHY
jgi:hypothetical protein